MEITLPINGNTTIPTPNSGLGNSFEQNNYNWNVPQGWQCPVCKHVYAPSWTYCTNCNNTLGQRIVTNQHIIFNNTPAYPPNVLVENVPNISPTPTPSQGKPLSDSSN